MILDKGSLDAFLNALSAGRELYVPGERNGITQFVKWDGGSVSLGGENTQMPPKDLLFPRTEKMYTMEKGTVTEITDVTEKAIFGIRPCDVRSIDALDAVFMKEGYREEFYSRRREKLLIVAISCPGAGENCFCEAMEVDPNSADTADVFLFDCGDVYSVTANTEKGKAWIEDLPAGIISDAEAPRGKPVHCSLQPNMSRTLSEALPSVFENREFWERWTSPCLKCGTCAFVCPSCYCFDINNSSDGKMTTAYRCWDSCVFSDYNLCAGGHTPRPTKLERLRNRYLHKLSYFNERHGMNLCVGCGRCIGKCPAHLDITEFINAAAEVTGV